MGVRYSDPSGSGLVGKYTCEHERSDSFAKFFDEKVRKITEEVTIDLNVFNGHTKIEADCQMFMGTEEVVHVSRASNAKIVRVF